MKKLSQPFITTAICVIIGQMVFSVNAITLDNNIGKQCFIDVPTFKQPLVSGNLNTLPILTEANRFETTYPNTAVYQGNVKVTQGNRTVHADKVTIDSSNEKQRTITLDGDVLYQDNLIKLDGSHAQIYLDSNDVKIDNSNYHFVDKLGHGYADEIQFKQNRYLILKNGNYTSCPINTHSWKIEGTTITHDNQNERIDVWNAVFRIGNVPVLYSPYIQLPTSSKRRSGLLIPRFSYNSDNGFISTVPFYWNIAPNYDATLTAKVIEKRGVQLQTETRYLNLFGQGTFAFDWLAHDKLYEKEVLDTSTNRWFFYLHNDKSFNQNWHFSIDHAKVSDRQYLTNLGSEFASETDGYLTQRYNINYINPNWDIGLSYINFQSFRPEVADNIYWTQPQLDINYYQNNFGPFSFKTYAQIAHFSSLNKNNPDTWRSHIEPSINYTVNNSWSSLSTLASVMATHYDQNSHGNYQQNDSINRILPKFSIDGKLIFENNHPFINNYSQTLEPRIKYLYIPYRDQSNIKIYDSTPLQSDYIGLFSDSSYSGLDRIASSNKIATGLTSRFYDKKNKEIFNASIGQITYFAETRTGENNSQIDKNIDTKRISWTADSFWQISTNLVFRGSIQHDARVGDISLANTSIEYRPSSEKLVQLSYRYGSKNYIDYLGLSNYAPYKQNISQTGIMLAWPISENLNAVGSYYYDTQLKQTVDGFIGLEYSDCCWGISFQIGRKLTDWDVNANRSNYENRYSINFELRGMGNSNITTDKMLNFGKLPYVSAF